LRVLAMRKVRTGTGAGPELLGYSEEADHRRAVSALVERQHENLELIEVKELFVIPNGAVGGEHPPHFSRQFIARDGHSLHSEDLGFGGGRFETPPSAI
jgi:hypothetical protein